MAGDAEVKLFMNRFSAFAQLVQIALKEKGIPFKPINVDLYSRDKPQALLDANPIHKKVPTVLHKGKPVAESLVILEYLEDAFPEHVPLRPKDAFEKSKVRFWTDYITKSYSTMGAAFRAKPGSPEKESAHEFKSTFYKTLDAAITSFSAEGPFFTGDKFGLIDVALAPSCCTLGLSQAFGGPPLPGPDELPRLYQWVEVVKVRPSVSSTLPSEQESLAYIRKAFQNLAATKPAGAPQ